MSKAKRSEARIFHDAGNMVEDLRGNWPRPWRVQIVRKGDHYGLDDCLIHEGPDAEELGGMVEFWDMTDAQSTKARIIGAPDSLETPRYTSTGQFVSRYYIKTFLAHQGKLNLRQGVPQWRISENTLKSIQTWIKVEVL